MRGETAYTADVTSRMAASQTRVPRDICTPSHDFLKLRALIDNRATGRVGESLRNFGPDLELGSARYAERARPRVETPLSPRSIDPKRILHFHPDFHRSLFRFLLLSTILSTTSNIIHRFIEVRKSVSLMLGKNSYKHRICACIEFLCLALCF